MRLIRNGLRARTNAMDGRMDRRTDGWTDERPSSMINEYDYWNRILNGEKSLCVPLRPALPRVPVPVREEFEFEVVGTPFSVEREIMFLYEACCHICAFMNVIVWPFVGVGRCVFLFFATFDLAASAAWGNRTACLSGFGLIVHSHLSYRAPHASVRAPRRVLF